jgi:hypothetical protein
MWYEVDSERLINLDKIKEIVIEKFERSWYVYADGFNLYHSDTKDDCINFLNNRIIPKLNFI